MEVLGQNLQNASSEDKSTTSSLHTQTSIIDVSVCHEEVVDESRPQTSVSEIEARRAASTNRSDKNQKRPSRCRIY